MTSEIHQLYSVSPAHTLTGQDQLWSLWHPVWLWASLPPGSARSVPERRAASFFSPFLCPDCPGRWTSSMFQKLKWLSLKNSHNLCSLQMALKNNPSAWRCPHWFSKRQADGVLHSSYPQGGMAFPAPWRSYPEKDPEIVFTAEAWSADSVPLLRKERYQPEAT